MATRAPSASSESFTITLALAAPESQLVAWLQQAAAGETVTYASGLMLPRDEPGVKLVQAWEREGLVALVSRRDPADSRRWLWLAQRSSTGPKAARQPRDRSDDIARIQERKLLDLLRGAADRGEPMPGRRWLARDLTGRDDRKGMNRVTYLLQRLAAAGSIDLTPAPRGAQHGPTVTILTGKHAGKSTRSMTSNTQRGV
jgi:hypothetical protein